MKKDFVKNLIIANRILLGALMLVPGLFKLFGSGVSGVSGMLSGMGFPIAGFFAVILIFSEIIFGGLVIAGWKLEYTVLPLAFILLVAWFSAHLGDWSRLVMHLTLITNYLIIAYHKN